MIPHVPIIVLPTIVNSPIPVNSPPPATIMQAAVNAPTYPDTAAFDTFPLVSGTLAATANINAVITYGIVGGAPDTSLSGYDQSLTGTYGTLYLNTATGAYAFIPNNAAINALDLPRNRKLHPHGVGWRGLDPADPCRHDQWRE